MFADFPCARTPLQVQIWAYVESAWASELARGQISIDWRQGCWTAADKSATAPADDEQPPAKLIGPARFGKVCRGICCEHTHGSQSLSTHVTFSKTFPGPVCPL